MGPVFLLSLVAVEWPFASFQMTKAADNPFFVGGYFSYSVPPWIEGALGHFVHPQHDLELWSGLGMAMLSSRSACG